MKRNKNAKTFDELSDEQILQEFVKRFNCNGAILIYHENEMEYGLGRWTNSIGKKWVKTIFNTIDRKSEASSLTAFQNLITN